MISLQLDNYDLFGALTDLLEQTDISTSNIFEDVSGEYDFTYHTLDPNELGPTDIYFAISFREHVTHRRNPDIFFSKAESLRHGRMGLFVYASKDESLTGRCNMIQHSDGSIFVTIINSEVTGMDLHGVFYDNHKGDIFALDAHVDEMKALQKISSPDFYMAIQLSIDNFVLLVARRIEDSIASIPQTYSDDEDEETFEPAEIPNFETVLAGSQDPLKKVNNDVMTIRDDTVAFKLRMNAVVPTATKVTFEVRGNSPCHIFNSSKVIIIIAPSSVHILTCGVPLAHVCYVLDLAIDLALKIDNHDCPAYQQLKKLLENVCSLDTVADIEEREDSKKRAILTMTRMLDRNLPYIKAKLWRPDGELVRKMIADDIQNVCDDKHA